MRTRNQHFRFFLESSAPKAYVEHSSSGAGPVMAARDVAKCGFAYFGAFSSKTHSCVFAKIDIMRTRSRYFRFFPGSSTPKLNVAPDGSGAGPAMADGDVAKCGFWDFGLGPISDFPKFTGHENRKSTFSIFLGILPTQRPRRAQRSRCRGRHARRRRRDVVFRPNPSPKNRPMKIRARIPDVRRWPQNAPRARTGSRFSARQTQTRRAQSPRRFGRIPRYAVYKGLAPDLSILVACVLVTQLQTV